MTSSWRKCLFLLFRVVLVFLLSLRAFLLWCLILLIAFKCSKAAETSATSAATSGASSGPSRWILFHLLFISFSSLCSFCPFFLSDLKSLIKLYFSYPFCSFDVATHLSCSVSVFSHVATWVFIVGRLLFFYFLSHFSLYQHTRDLYQINIFYSNAFFTQVLSPLTKENTYKCHQQKTIYSS